MRTYYVAFWDADAKDYVSIQIRRRDIREAEAWGMNKSSRRFRFHSVSS